MMKCLHKNDETFFKIYMMTETLIQRRCVLKSHNEIKAEMETIQQQMMEAKKSERTQRSEAAMQRVWLYGWDA